MFGRNLAFGPNWRSRQNIGSAIGLPYVPGRYWSILLVAWMMLAAGCLGVRAAPSSGATPTASPTLTIYGWAGYMPQSILDDFTAEFGVPVTYLEFASYRQALGEIRAGQIYDVVVLSNDAIASASAENLLAPLDPAAMPNTKNLSPNFRDLVYDPGNHYSVPFQWGTTGLLVRTDLVTGPVDSWAALWDPAYVGRVAIWDMPRDVIGMTLKSLGYSLNSEDPAELEAAAARLAELQGHAIVLDSTVATLAPELVSGRIVLAMGWGYDYLAAREELETVDYVLPREGTLLWVDHLTVPANSPHREWAQQFINFILRPEISARMVNELAVATPNEQARPYIDPALLANPGVYPPLEALEHAELFLPLNAATLERYDQIWQQFRSARATVAP